MRSNQLLFVTLGSLLMACAGEKDGETPHTGLTAEESPILFQASAEVGKFNGELPADTVLLQQISNTFLGAVSVVAADTNVQARLNAERQDPARQYLDCWISPDIPRYSFQIDYTGCSGYGMGGGTYINDHPSGPLLFEFLNFSIGERTLGGVFALDSRESFGANHWVGFDTDNTSPGLDNRVQLGVDIQGNKYGLSWLGGTKISYLEREWATWGTASVTINENSYQVVHGARTSEEIDPSSAAPESAVTSTLDWSTCRCPMSGITSYESLLTLSEVTVDIDKLEIEPDGIDDPKLVFDLDTVVAGRIILSHTGCGEYDAEWEGEETIIQISAEQLSGAISFQCETLAIEDPARCLEMLATAQDNDGVQLIVSSQDIANAAKRAAKEQFDTSWCSLY